MNSMGDQTSTKRNTKDIKHKEIDEQQLIKQILSNWHQRNQKKKSNNIFKVSFSCRKIQEGGDCLKEIKQCLKSTKDFTVGCISKYKGGAYNVVMMSAILMILYINLIGYSRGTKCL